MVAAFDYCLHGRGGAAPSIDTAMHGLVDAAHVDHLHPDSGIALATAADGEALTRDVLRRPRGLGAVAPAGLPARPRHRGDPARRTRRPSARSSAATASPPGATPRDECEADSLEIIGTAAAVHRRARPAGAVRPAASRAIEPLPPRPSAARAPPPCCPLVRGLASTDRPQVGHYTDDRRRARLPGPRASTRGWPRSGTSLPRPLPAHQGPAAGARPAADGAARGRHRAAARAARGVPRRLRAPTTSATRRPTARRCAAPTRRSSWCPGVGMFSLRRGQADRAGRRRVLRQRDQRDARRRGRVDVRADPRGREVPDRVLGARGGQARAPAEAQAARHPGRARHRRRLGHRPGDRPPARRRGRLRRRRRPRRGRAREAVAARARRTGRRGRRSPPTSPTRPQVAGAFRRRRARVRRRRPRRQQRRPVDLEAAARDDRRRLGPAARRDGAGLVPGVARGGADHDRPGHGRRHRLHRQQERVLRRAEQRRLRRVQGRPGAPGPAARGRARRSSASASTASTPTASSAAPGSSPRAGAPTGRGRTASPRTSSASSTPSARCSSARSCPSTSRRPSSR